MNISDKYLQETFGKHEPREIEELVFDNFWADKANFTEEEKQWVALTAMNIQQYLITEPEGG